MKFNKGDIVYSGLLEVEVYSCGENKFSGIVIKTDSFYPIGFETDDWDIDLFELKIPKKANKDILKLEYERLFEFYAIRVFYQDFDILKRGNFNDEELKIKSSKFPCYVEKDDVLCLKGERKELDKNIIIVSEETFLSILKRVNLLNKKYKIKSQL